jgi:alkylation response protein AidB-like acyl-CoA dehydrogenase
MNQIAAQDGLSKSLEDLDDGEFAHRLRQWLESHYPQEWRQPIVLRLRGEDERMWLRTLNKHGLRSPGLPAKFGGMGLSLRKQLIYKSVFDEYGVARVLDIGGTLLAPVLVRYGTPEQQAHYLPRILNCDDMWCQGYSEPGAGSDLASLRTRAVQRGDVFVINGQKIWTSHATTATHIFVLARTGDFPRKQQGISFILVNMKSPGITVRPIVNLAGDDEFCEVFFDEVEVPLSNLVGGLNEGWAVAKSLLGVERLVTGSPTLASQAFDYLMDIACADDIRQNARHDDRLRRVACDLHDAKALYQEVCAAAVSGATLDAEYSVLKVCNSELFQRVCDLALELSNERAGMIDECTFGEHAVKLHRMYMVSRPATIYGGTAEVQRDILARVLLGSATQSSS